MEAIPATTPFLGPEQIARARGLTQLVRLGANESPFGASPRALAAMRDELERIWWYGDPESFALRTALAARLGVQMEELCVGAGIDDLMGLVVRAYVAPGESIVTTRGTYPTLEYHALGYGAQLQRAAYRNDGTLDVDELIELAQRHRAALLYLANPDNPSGSFVRAGELARLRDALPQETLLLLDEAYADFVPAGDLLAPLIDERVVRTRTFSKAYGLAGARIGYAIASVPVIATLGKIRLQYGVNRNAQIGALAALHDDAFISEVVAQTRIGRAEYAAFASERGIATIDSQTNFQLFDCGNAARALQVLDELLARGVWIRKPGAPPLDRFVRATVGTPGMRAIFLDALAASVAKVPA